MLNLRELQQFEEFLEQTFNLHTKNTSKTLADAMRYSLFSGGKRIRPILFLKTYELFRPIDEIALNFASAIEVFHTFTLIHDDLPCMDNDDYRRGKPTNHKVFGEGQAVLAGDALQNLCYEYIIEAISKSEDKNVAIIAMQRFTDYVGASGLMSGQSIDITSCEKIDHALVDYVYTHKTCDLICASMVCAAIIAGADKTHIDLVSKYAYNFGYVFQIIDDVLDEEKTKGEKTILSVYNKEKVLEIVDNLIAEAIDSIKKLPKNTEFFTEIIKKSKLRKS